jgi:hypothetical protein
MKILWTSASACAPTRARKRILVQSFAFLPVQRTWRRRPNLRASDLRISTHFLQSSMIPRSDLSSPARGCVCVRAKIVYMCTHRCFHEVVRKILHCSILCTRYKISFKIWDKICTIYTLANESLPRQSNTATLLLRKALSCQIPNFASKSRSFHRTLFRLMRDNGRERKLIHSIKQRVNICI